MMRRRREARMRTIYAYFELKRLLAKVPPYAPANLTFMLMVLALIAFVLMLLMLRSIWLGCWR
jgi:hypothetical protein